MQGFKFCCPTYSFFSKNNLYIQNRKFCKCVPKFVIQIEGLTLLGDKQQRDVSSTVIFIQTVTKW